MVSAKRKEWKVISKALAFVAAANLLLAVGLFTQAHARQVPDKSCTEQTASGPGGFCSTAGLDWHACENDDDCGEA